MNRQLELAGIATSGSEQLDIAYHELSALEQRLATEGRYVFRLDVRKGGYHVTIKALSTRQFTCSGCGRVSELAPDALHACGCSLPLCPRCQTCQWCAQHPTKPDATPDATRPCTTHPDGLG